MNIARPPKYLLVLFLALGLAAGPIVRADEEKAEAASTPPAAPEAPTAPQANGDQAKPDDKQNDAAATGESPDDAAATPASEATESKGASDAPSAAHPKKHRQHRSGGSNERVSFHGDSTLAEGETAESVVSIAGSSTSAGTVDDAVVSVIGGSRVTGGTVGDSVVSILGNTYVDGHVKGEVVTVLGNVEFGPNAVVDGEVVCVGGQITRDPKAVIKGDIQNIAIAGQHFNFDGLTVWFSKCLLFARLLAFDSRLLWAWGIALAFLGFYAVIALIAPAGVVKCVETLEQRPGSSLLTAVLTLILTPITYILLAFTVALGIGIALLPAFSLGLFMAALFGKIVILAWLGRRFTKLLGDGPLSHPAAAVIIGGLIVTLIYTIPIVGIVTHKLLGLLGLGVVIYTLILQLQAARAARPVPPPKPAAVVVPPVLATGDTPVTPPPASVPVTAAPPVISAATLPRVGFWIRVVASFLDFVLVAIVSGMLGKFFHGWGSGILLWFAVYCTVMWATKGTTIGGIICGLKVVRLDDRPIDWGVAIVRALGGFLSLAVAGLGFIWVAFDDERQSWHDKIAGTTIVKVPKGTPLM